jgi:hypothetical protein
VLTGPVSAALSSRGGTRPWRIASVYLFDAKQLLSELRAGLRPRSIRGRTTGYCRLGLSRYSC